MTTETYNGTSYTRLSAGAPISAVPGNADSATIVSLLGFSNPGTSSVSQVATDASAWTDGVGAATGATPLSSLGVGGASPGLAAGDQIVITGTRGDGVPVSNTMTLVGGETVQDLLDRLNSSAVFGNATRSATASLSGGTLSLTDSVAGASQLGISIVVKKASGATATLGQMTTTTAGYDRRMVQGSDAQISVDGNILTRSSNTITDAIPGVTLNLTGAAPGTTVDMPVNRDVTAITGTMQAFVTAYNNVVAFVNAQTASGAALAGDVTARTTMRAMTENVLDTVSGLTGNYTTSIDAGLSVDKTGVLSLDSTKFSAALTDNFAAVKALFGRTVTTTPGLTYVSAGTATQTGVFPVTVTAPSLQPGTTGSGFSGTYTDSGSPDGFTVTDGISLSTGRVTFATGDTLTTIVDKLNTMFTTQGMTLTASAASGQLSIQSSEYGSSAKFSIALDSGNNNPTTQLGIAAGTYTGTDVVGTIGGVAATGNGQQLMAAVGTPAEGLTVMFTGTAPYTGSVSHTLGIAALVSNAADSIARTGDGIAETEQTALTTRVGTLTDRVTQLQAQLDAQRATMTAEFTAMESALSLLQSQTAALTSQTNALQSIDRIGRYTKHELCTCRGHIPRTRNTFCVARSAGRHHVRSPARQPSPGADGGRQWEHRALRRCAQPRP